MLGFRDHIRALVAAGAALVAVGAVLAHLGGGPALAKGKPASWKSIDDALLLVNNNPVKEWGLFQAGNKRDPLLLQMGNRFLLIKIHDRQVFEIDKSKVQSKSGELLFDPAEHPDAALPTSEWEAADMEAVYRIRAKINSEDRLLDIELPHQLDLSGMSPHAATRDR